MKILTALANTLISALLGFGLLFAFGMGSGFAHDISNSIVVTALATVLVSGIVIGWFWALTPEGKLSQKTILAIIALSIPLSLILMKVAEGSL